MSLALLLCGGDGDGTACSFLNFSSTFRSTPVEVLCRRGRLPPVKTCPISRVCHPGRDALLQPRAGDAACAVDEHGEDGHGADDVRPEGATCRPAHALQP